MPDHVSIAIGKFQRQPEILNLEKQTRIGSTHQTSWTRFIVGIPLLFSRRLKVFNPAANAHVYTSVSKSDWKKVKLAGRDEQSVRRLSKSSDAKRRGLALDIIRKTGQANGLSVLEKASTHQLCLIARQLGKFGSNQTFRDKVFSALREAQTQYAATSLDDDSAEMLHAMAADSWQAKVAFEKDVKEAKDPRAVSAQIFIPSAAVGGVDKAQSYKDDHAFLEKFRKFAGKLISVDERDRDQPPDSNERAQRLRDVCADHLFLLEEFGKMGSDKRKNLMEWNGLSADFGYVLSDVVERFGKQPSRADIRRTDLAPFKSLARAVDAEVARYDLQRYGELLKQKISTAGAGALGEFLNKVFDEYFLPGAQSHADRKAMIASLLSHSSAVAMSQEQTTAMLKGAGPYMHKILQLFGDKIDETDDDAKALKAALGQLKDGLLPIAPDIKKAMLADIVRQSDGRITALQDVRSLSAASVGETLFARINVTGQSATGGSGEGGKLAVVKLLRPGVELRAARERDMMERIARSVAGMEETFAGIADQIDRELDLSKEADNVDLAKVYRVNGSALQPVRQAPGLTGSRTYLFMERAPGSTVQQHLTHLSNDRLPLEDRLRRGIDMANRLDELAGRWLKEGLFESGFYHGDLHAGNMMYQAADPKDPDVTEALTLIDFGNAATLTKDERAAMLKLLITAEMKYPEAFIDTLERMLGPVSARLIADNPDLKATMVADIAKVFGTPGLSGAQRMNQAFTRLNAHHIAVPGTVVNFARSQQMLEETAKSLNRINERNWEAWSKRPESQRVAPDQALKQPVALSISKTFKDTIMSRTYKLAWLLGRSVLSLRNENPVFAQGNDAGKDELLQLPAGQGAASQSPVRKMGQSQAAATNGNVPERGVQTHPLFGFVDEDDFSKVT